MPAVLALLTTKTIFSVEDEFGLKQGDVCYRAGFFFVGPLGHRIEGKGNHSDIALSFGQIREPSAGGIGNKRDLPSDGRFECRLVFAERGPQGIGPVNAKGFLRQEARRKKA